MSDLSSSFFSSAEAEWLAIDGITPQAYQRYGPFFTSTFKTSWTKDRLQDAADPAPARSRVASGPPPPKKAASSSSSGIKRAGPYVVLASPSLGLLHGILLLTHLLPQNTARHPALRIRAAPLWLGPHLSVGTVFGLPGRQQPRSRRRRLQSWSWQWRIERHPSHVERDGGAEACQGRGEKRV